MEPQTKKGGIAPFVLSGVIFLIGIVGFVVFLFLRVSHLDKDMIQVVVPGSQDVTLSEPGDYTIFHEYRSVIGNEIYATDRGISGLQCTLTSQKTGEAIALSASSGSSHYEVEGRKGESVFAFHIEEPGVYRLTGRYPEGQNGPRTVLAISHGFVEDLLVTIFLSLSILFGSIVLSIVIVVVTLIKRQKAASA